ncbi:thioredoxin-disulfide reductase [bacterium endosymbiont of Pedicinus badii]|uniref:thioredoxin-disulfide reductase n=1 Tax=bacterium endosymbiont of Pedicinus badii TaxID=1719126 RepID=UPI0009BBA893|nr:thioredoxin-disulfide reductase [bacterium endosymbiont of Pedicinus badii]OQM34340.1 thioredoxin reductase [bacterium endosymbiont of Pedicinus badii]
MQKNKIVIIGSGPAGYTASIYSSRSGFPPILITGNLPGGQLNFTENIENWPGQQKISGRDLMENMQKQTKKLGTKVVFDTIKSVDFQKNPFILFGEKNKYICNCVIIATGSSPKYLGIKSEQEYLGKGVSTCAVCDGFFYRNKNVAVVGGGNTALEEVIYLSKIVKKIYLIHRREIFRAEDILIKKLKKCVEVKKNIKIYKNFEIKKILGNKDKIKSIIIKEKNKKIEKKIQISGIFIAIGYIPNSKIFIKHIKTHNGYICTNFFKKKNFSTSTSVEGVFAAGDIIDPFYRQAITSSASGCMAALDAKKYLMEKSF